MSSVLLAALFACMCTTIARGTTYYVAPGGNDGSAGTNWTTARQTIQGGVNAATVAGDHVIVSNGIYTLTNQVSVIRAIAVRSLSGNSADVTVNGDGVSRCFNLSAAATLSGLTITRGTAAAGGGVFMSAAGTVTNCVLHCNVASGDPAGGGVYISASGGWIVNCTFTGNRTTGGSSDGGAIIMYGGYVRGCEFITNSAARWGGAIRMDNGTVSECSFVSNRAPASGPGAVQLRINNPVLSNCVFRGNYAVGGGGAVGIAAGVVYGCTMLSNTVASDTSGGALNVGGGLVDRCVIGYNRTLNNDAGGAVIGSGTMRNCLVFGNYAPRYGGGIRMESGTLENCTLVGNRSDSAYGGIWNRGGTIRNMIIYSNTAPSSANYDNSMAAFIYTCTVPLRTGVGNTNAYPRFVAPGSGYGLTHIAGDYQLLKGSPCVHSGTNITWMTNALDLAGFPRLASIMEEFEGTVDMGAYELQPPIPGMVLQVN